MQSVEDRNHNNGSEDSGLFYGLSLYTTHYTLHSTLHHAVKRVHRLVLLLNIIVGVNFHFWAPAVVNDMGPRLFGSRLDTAFILFQGSSNGREEDETG